MKTRNQVKKLLYDLEAKLEQGQYKLSEGELRLKIALLRWVLEPVEKRNIIQYNHHGWDVSVDEELKGKHREHCLCFICERFAPNQPFNCPLAQEVFETCVKFGMATPVFECSMFEEGEPDLTNLAEETY